MTDLLHNHHWLYPALIHLHRSVVSASIALFLAKGIGVALQGSWPMRAWWRRLSVVIDVFLLASGASLWALLSYHPLQQTWLGTKLALLLVYIVLGSYGLKRGATRTTRMLFFAAALLVVTQMVWIARTRQPLGLLAGG